ncbi:Uncharacterized protein BM_BM2228 [Brugia malayi]|uniref:Protein quiver n=2 Tax=Brugia malayi TaxID=6279 RepID=A0A4E9F650_BRUMA|nr:Uncharacterized protein BM_BM2228 [Brugia malayi]VIO91445.1 Uncharacterized protein BM_BM2228 [Brugia malayi]
MYEFLVNEEQMRVLTTNLLLFAVGLIVIADRPMRCYQCNSANDANCDSSDAKDLNQYTKLCPLLKDGTYAGNKPIACRKIVQSVEELPAQIIRECAYTGDKQLDGIRKQGNKAVKLLYYHCENVNGDIPCNGTQQITTRYLSLILLFVIIIAIVHPKYQ